MAEAGATTPTISLPRRLLNEILGHAQRDPAREVCGLVSARGGRAVCSYPIPNCAATPQTRFVMEPAAQIAAMRTMREHGEELFGIYHSHPTGPAIPSAIDLAEAAYSEAVYFIISLNLRGVLEVQAFRLHGGAARSVELDITQ